jgi:hypothetical protein
MMSGIGLYPIDQVCWATLSALPANSKAVPNAALADCFEQVD